MITFVWASLWFPSSIPPEAKTSPTTAQMAMVRNQRPSLFRTLRLFLFIFMMLAHDILFNLLFQQPSRVSVHDIGWLSLLRLYLFIFTRLINIRYFLSKYFAISIQSSVLCIIIHSFLQNRIYSKTFFTQHIKSKCTQIKYFYFILFHKLFLNFDRIL